MTTRPTPPDAPLRLFIAADLPQPARDYAARVVDRIRADLSTGNADPRALRWVAPDALHLTLRFLGDTDPDRIAAISGAIDRAAADSLPVQLRFGQVGRFGSPKRPRVLWLGPEPDPVQLPRLHQLADQIDRALRDNGIEIGDRRFRPHITLARVRRNAGPLPQIAQISAPSEPRAPAAGIRAISLIHSTLTPQGPVYRTLHRSQLSTDPPNSDSAVVG